MTDPKDPAPIKLAANAPMKAFQRYIHDLEAMHGWLNADLIKNCFLMGEEVGELFGAIRRHLRQTDPTESNITKAQVAEELVDVLNFLLAIANRLDIDVEDAFRTKNARNQTRTW